MYALRGRPPLAWRPFALVAMAHGAGLWAATLATVDVPARPGAPRFALTTMAIPSEPRQPAAPVSPPPTPQPAVEPAPQAVAPVPAEAKPVIATAAPAERKTVHAARPATPVRRPVAPPARKPPAATPPPKSAAPPPASAAPVADGPPTTFAAASAEATASAGPVVAEGAADPLTPPSFAADYLDNPPPPYPRISRRLGEQGTVWLLVRVEADGGAEQVTVEHSSGHSRLDRAALQAVRDWRFVPARRYGRAVAAAVRVPVKFSLEDAR